MPARQLYVPAGTAATGSYELEVTPESAGWRYSSLRVVALQPGQSVAVNTGPDEMIVLPLTGAVTVEQGPDRVELGGRSSVFDGPTDTAYLPVGSRALLTSAKGGRYALCGARTNRVLPFRHQRAADVPVELRGTGQCSRQVRNFATPDALDAGAVIACEVITPSGNWSSYPAHKHDEAGEHESELEEIYYFEIGSGPAGERGLGFFRVSSSPGKDIDLCVEVHDRDAVLVPYGWHGPASAAPGFAMYYLNVMAGPKRAWLITDHPDQAWVRNTWPEQPLDPRLQED